MDGETSEIVDFIEAFKLIVSGDFITQKWIML